MSQQPPKQGHYGYQGRQQAPQQNVGAWQPAAPTSQQTQQQQQQFSHARGGGYTVPMNPYAYAGGATNYNPYYAQQGGRVGGWNPNYAGGPPMYQPGPGVYYPQQQPQPQAQQQQQQSNPKPTVTQPRAKKALVITDKDGNPIDLSSVKKSSKTPAPAPAPAPVLSPAPAPAPVAAPAPVPVSASKLDSIESKKPSSEETSNKQGKEKSGDMSEGSSLMALLTKQEKKEVEKPAVVSPSTSPMAMAEKTGRKRHVYSKEEMLR